MAGVALAAFLITLMIAASSAAARARQAAAQSREEARRAQKAPILTTEELALSVDDFILPPPPPTETEPRYVPFRPRQTRWSAEAADRYWVAPRQIATEIVESMNDASMERLFRDVK